MVAPDRAGRRSRQDGRADPPLLGREDELARLTEVLERTRTGHGGLVLLEGEPGIGKTRLLGELDRVAEALQLRRLSARADPLENTLSFGVVIELIDPLLRAPEPERDELLSGAARLALALVDTTPAPAGPRPADAAERIVHGVFHLLASAARRQPTALLVDDLQWADPASLRALAHVMARAGTRPMCVIASVRAGERPVDPDALRALREDPATTIVVPAPLRDDAVPALAAQAGVGGTTPALNRACVRATGGNPLLLRELLAAIASHGEPEAGAPIVEQVGREGIGSVARHARARLSTLPRRAGELAHAAAVLGDGAPLRHAAQLTGLEIADACAAADALVDARLLDAIDPVRFCHPLVRESLSSAIPPGARATLHARAARIVADDDPDPERPAAHLLPAVTAGDQWVVGVLRDAARQALDRAVPEAAVRYLVRAVEEPPDPGARGAVLLELGRAQTTAGMEAGEETLERAVAALDDGLRRAEALLVLGRARFASGRLKAAARAFDEGLAAVPDHRDAVAQELRTELNAAFIGAARFDADLQPEAQRRLEPLLDTVEDGATPGERALLAEVALERGVRGVPAGEAVALALRAWAGGAILDELDRQGIVLSQISATLTWSDAIEQSERILTQAIAHARRTGAPLAAATASYLRAWPRFYRGALKPAAADARRALATDGWEMYEPAARGVLAQVLLERADPAGAADVLAVEDADERWGDSIPYALMLEARARLDMLRGRHAEALDCLLSCGDLLAGIGGPHPFCPWRSRAALCLDRLGDPARARRLAAEEARLARSMEIDRPLGEALRVAGMLERGPRGLEHLREAVAVLEHSPARLAHTRALVELGARLRRGDEAREARPILRDALALADEMAATALAEHAHAELVAAGGRPRRLATRGVGALTAAELRTARLAAAGLSNREIADEMFVVPKTVQYHLTNAYRKLGVRRREDLAAHLG